MHQPLAMAGPLFWLVAALVAVGGCGSEGQETLSPTPGGGSGGMTTSLGGSGGGGAGGATACVGRPAVGALACDGSFEPIGEALDRTGTDYAYTPALTIDGTGQPVVAWHEMADGNYSIMVKAWTGAAWQLLGDGPVDLAPGSNSQAPALVTGCDGYPVAAWGEDHAVYVKRWDGAAWQQLGGALNVRTADDVYAMTPAMAVDSQGRVLVAWTEWDSSLAYDVYVKRWDGSSWELLGGAQVDSIPEDFADSPALAVDAEDRPLVAWDESDAQTGSTTRHETFVARWQGSAWEQLGGGAIAPVEGIQTYSASLQLDATGAPVVALYELLADGLSSRVYVVRLEGDAWVEMADPFPLAAGESGNSPWLAFDGQGVALVTWNVSTATDNSVRLTRWDGGAWQQLGPDALDLEPAQSAYGQVLAIDPSGKPIVAWNEWSEPNASYDLYAVRCQ
jgi:hypothetical protein